MAVRTRTAEKMAAIELGPDAHCKRPVSMHTVVAGSRLTFLTNVGGGGFAICPVSAKTIRIHVDARDQLPNYRQRLELGPEPTLQRQVDQGIKQRGAKLIGSWPARERRGSGTRSRTLNRPYVLLVFEPKSRRRHTEGRVLRAFLETGTASSLVGATRSRLLPVWVVATCT